MKKVLLFLAAAAMLAVSCAKDPQGLIGDQTKVTFTVDASQVATRAVTGTHGTANRLMVGVYIKSGTTYNYIQEISQSNTVSEWPTVVSLDLAKNETYKLVFWADEGTDAYTINWANGTVAEAATTIAGNATNRDAYYKMVEITTNGANGGAITLTRPLAQVNVGTNDLAAYKAAAVYDGNIETQVVVSGVVPGMNLLTGEASTGEPVDLTFSYADNLDATLVSGGNDYGYLGMNFVLCPGDATLTAQISLRKDDAAEAINEFTVSYLPVKTNYRTNIVGKLLTGTVQYSVDVDTDFADDLQKLVAPTFESIEALNTYLAGLTSGPANGDHGDIKPEVAIVSGIGDVKTIVLPNDTLHLALQILAAYNGDDGLTIAYPTGEGAKHTKVLYVTIPELSKLTANLPDTHLELVTGSSVDLTDVHTSENTFVIQEGARVGRLNINQGNAEIAGAVANVYVVADATSNGETPDGTNPVQVFLSSESAVQQVELNAAADVVVEQPKDNIDVSGTEYKVEVVVNADDCSAKAQNGGQIYVVVAAGVGSCTVSADGESDAQSASGATIAEVGAGSTVDTYKGGEGIVTIKEGVNTEQVNEQDYQAKIGNAYYETVQKAFEAAVAGDIVVVLVEEFTKISSGTFAIDPSAYVADGYLSYPNEDGTFTVVPGILVQHSGTNDTDPSHTANGTLLKNAVQGAADGTAIYLTAGIYWLPGNDFRFPDNKSFSIIGIGDVRIFSNGYGFAVNKSEHEGIAVTLKNLTITNGPNKPNAVYIKDYMILTLEDVVLHNYAVANKYSIVLDSSNPIDNAFDSNKTTTLIAKNVSIDDGLKIGLMAMPRQYYIDKGYSATISTKCSVTFDGKCVNFEGNVEAQDGEPCSTGSNLIVNGVALPEPPVAPTVFNVSTPAEFIAVFSDNAIRTKNTQININADIDLSDAEAHSPIDISNMDKASITVNGNNHKIKGMKKPMFDQCFVASIAVNDLTFKDCSITEASDGYVAVIAAYYDAGKFLNVENVMFDNCDLTGSNYAGLIYGAGGGYGNQNDGPVHMGALVKGCTATGCDLVSTGGGSVGAIAGHAAWNDWTKLTVENCTVTNCTMTTSKAVKAGSFFGTVGIAGSVVYGRQCGIYLKNCEWSGNVATAKDVVSPYIFGRVAQNGGELYVYDSVESDYVLAAYNHGSGDVVEREDLVSENRFSSQQ